MTQICQLPLRLPALGERLITLNVSIRHHVDDSKVDLNLLESLEQMGVLRWRKLLRQLVYLKNLKLGLEGTELPHNIEYLDALFDGVQLPALTNL